jgi:uncharacterized protein (DUF433 family)
MASALRTAYAHIIKDPGVCGGKACIAGTRVRVMDIVELQREGRRPEEMLNMFAISLTLAQVYSALAFAYDHPDEIEADFASGAQVEADIERDRIEYLSRRRNQ